MPHAKLRQDIVRSLPYTGSDNRQCIYWDEILRGFGLRVFPGGHRAYVCAYRIHGRRRLATLGRADVLTLDEGRKKARRYLGSVADDCDPQSNAAAPLLSVSHLVELYLENHAKKKKRTWQTDECCLNRLLVKPLGARPAATVAVADIERIHARYGAQAPYAANRFITVVRKMFNWARVAGYVARDFQNPAVGIVRFPERRRRRFVTTVEMPRLLEALEREDNEFARHAIWLLLLIGLRKSELLRTKWSDVDWEFRTLFVGLTKNGEPVLAPLSDAAIERLRLVPRLSNNEHIICGHIAGAPLKYLSSAWRRVRVAAGLVDLRLHDLRRTVGSWLVQHGESLHLVGAVLNHKDTKTTSGYAYFQTQHQVRALTSHGENVLAFAPVGRTRAALPPVATIPAISREADLREPTGTGKSRAHFLTRELLYELVWQAPVSEVAARLGLTDVGLAKACRRSNIPVPPRGYWAKLESGKWVTPKALPAPPEGFMGTVRIKGRGPAAATARPDTDSNATAA